MANIIDHKKAVDASNVEMKELYFPLEPTGDADDLCEVYRIIRKVWMFYDPYKTLIILRNCLYESIKFSNADSDGHCVAWNASKQTGGLIG